MVGYRIYSTHGSVIGNHATADTVKTSEQGELRVLDEDGKVIALYAFGSWKNAIYHNYDEEE